MSPQAGYRLQEAVVPRLRSVVPHAVRCVGCEHAQELIQDGTAMAALMLESAERAGVQITAGTKNALLVLEQREPTEQPRQIRFSQLRSEIEFFSTRPDLSGIGCMVIQ